MTTLKAQLVEKQTVQAENDRLKLQLDSMHAQSQIEQKKAGEDRSESKLDMQYIDVSSDAEIKHTI